MLAACIRTGEVPQCAAPCPACYDGCRSASRSAAAVLDATSPEHSPDLAGQEEGGVPPPPAEPQAGISQRAPVVAGGAEVVQVVTMQGGYVENIIGKQVIQQPYTPRSVAATPEELAEAAARLSALPTDAIPEPQDVLPPSSWMNSLSRNRQFVGRETDLVALAALLKGGETVAVSQAQSAVASGLGGIGKTQLAIEFAYRFGHFFAGVFWLSFDQPDAIPAEIARLGRAAHLQLFTEASGLKLDEQVNLVRSRLASGLPYLLIFDNCEDPDLVRAHHPGGAARVLITSRNPDWPGDLGVRPHALGVLSRAESIALLRQHRPDLGHEDADALAAELGDLPLALHLAGRFLARYTRVLAPDAYLAELRSPRIFERLPLLKQDGKLPTGHERDVARTFALSYKRLNPDDAEDAVALRLLARVAHLMPGEVITADLLRAMLEQPKNNLDAQIAAENALERLVGLGLVERETSMGVRMHRLVAVYVRQVCGEADARAAVERVVLEVSRRISRQGIPVHLTLIRPHLGYLAAMVTQRNDAGAAQVFAEYGELLTTLGEYLEAARWYERALAVYAALGRQEHTETLRLQDRRALVLKENGEIDAARALVEQTLAARQRTVGPNHLDTAASLYQLADLCHLQGEVAEAGMLYERVYIIRAEQLGATHHLSLVALTKWIQHLLQSDPAAADTVLASTSKLEQQLLGKPSPTLADGLALVQAFMPALLRHDLQAVETIVFRLREVAQGWLDTHHPDVPPELRPWLQEALTVGESDTGDVAAHLETLVGARHPVIAAVLLLMGMLYQASGEVGAARQHYEQALRLQGEHGRADHLHTATIHSWLGKLLANNGEFDLAREHLRIALTIADQRLGPDNATVEMYRRDLESV